MYVANETILKCMLYDSKIGEIAKVNSSKGLFTSEKNQEKSARFKEKDGIKSKLN